MNHYPPPLDTGFEGDHLTPTVDFVYPEDEELPPVSEREVMRTVVYKLLNFIFRKPFGQVPERRLILIGIVLGVESLRGMTLAEFARERGISTNSASEHLRKIREHFGFPANNISTAKFRKSCQKGAKKRWAKKK